MPRGKVQSAVPVLPVLTGALALATVALAGLYLLDRAAGATVAMLASLV